MRTDGSLIKAPGVVCRPVQSISWRSMNRIGETVVGTDRLQFNTLRDKRTGDENRPLFDFLLTFGGLVSRGIGKHCSGKYAGRDESCSAGRYQRLHKQNYTREGAARKLSKR